MKWQTPKAVAAGTVRLRSVFAIRPHRCADGTTRWLERLQIKETRSFSGVPGCRWRDKKYLPIKP